MKISLIAALSKNHVIGKHGQLPWHLPKDMQAFKKLTLNKPIIMGRKTFESIGRLLPHRVNIILTQQESFTCDGGVVTHDVCNAIAAAEKAMPQAEEMMVIGGGHIYQAFLPLADRLYLTIVNAYVFGDAFFPEWDEREWQEVHRTHHITDEEHVYNFDMVILDRVQVGAQE